MSWVFKREFGRESIMVQFISLESQLTFARLYKINIMFVFNAISFFCNYHLEFSDSSGCLILEIVQYNA